MRDSICYNLRLNLPISGLGLTAGPFYILPLMRDLPLNYTYNEDKYKLPDDWGLPPPFVPNNEPAYDSACAFGEDLKHHVVKVCRDSANKGRGV